MAVADVTYSFVGNTKAVAEEVNTNFDDIVDFLNNQTIHADASVAFTGIPAGPALDPTGDNQFTRKKYVDDNFAAASHNHDGRYYTEGEVDSLLSGKSNTGHTHDSRYVNESGDTISGTITTSGDLRAKTLRTNEGSGNGSVEFGSQGSNDDHLSFDEPTNNFSFVADSSEANSNVRGGDFVPVSSRVFKQNERPAFIEFGAANQKLARLLPKKFEVESDNGVETRFGFVAEDVEQALPEIIKRNDEDVPGYSLPQLVAVLVSAVQELQAEVEELKQ